MSSQLSPEKPILAVFVGVMFIAAFVWLRPNPSITTIDASPTSDNIYEQPVTPGSPDPIYDETDAISRSMGLLPKNAYTEAVVARLVSLRTYATALGEMESNESLTTPVWVVAFRVNGLTEEELLDPSGIVVTYPPQSASSIITPEAEWTDPNYIPDGVFYGWDANDGVLMGAATLPTSPENSALNLTFADIQQWNNVVLSIVTASPPPIINGPFVTTLPVNDATPSN